MAEKNISIADYEGSFKPGLRDIDAKSVALKEHLATWGEITKLAREEASDFTRGGVAPVYQQTVAALETFGTKITALGEAFVTGSSHCAASADKVGAALMGVQARSAEDIKKL